MKITKAGYIYQESKTDLEPLLLAEDIEKPENNYSNYSNSKNKFTIILAGGTISAWGSLSTGVSCDNLKTISYINKLNNDIFKKKLKFNIVETKVSKLSENTNDSDFEEILNLRKNIKGPTLILFGTDKLADLSAYLKLHLEDSTLLTIISGAMKSPARPGCEQASILNFMNKIVKNDSILSFGVYLLGIDESGTATLHYPQFVYKYNTFTRDSFKSKNEYWFLKIKYSSKHFFINYIFNTNYLQNLNKSINNVIFIDDRYFDYNLIKYAKNYIIVIKGTGLGHINIQNLSKIENLRKNNKIIITSSCPTGSVRNDIYKTGRDLKKLSLDLNNFNYSDTFLYYYLKYNYEF